MHLRSIRVAESPVMRAWGRAQPARGTRLRPRLLLRSQRVERALRPGSGSPSTCLSTWPQPPSWPGRPKAAAFRSEERAPSSPADTAIILVVAWLVGALLVAAFVTERAEING